jgi:FkbM family methyltransferase
MNPGSPPSASPPAPQPSGVGFLSRCYRSATYRTRRMAHNLAVGFGLAKPTASDMSSRYDRELTRLMKAVLHPHSTCVDIGANAGAILEEMIRVAPHGRHFAIEPIPALAAALAQKFASARVAQCACSDSNGQAQFHVDRNVSALSGLRRTHNVGDSNVDIVNVEVRTLDSMIPAGETVALIKIDAEGNEIPIMRGARETIARCRPYIVFEAGSSTTGVYNISADEVYDCVTQELGMQLSTMSRWFSGKAPFSREEFRHASDIDDEPFLGGCPDFDFYFLAYDQRDSATPHPSS